MMDIVWVLLIYILCATVFGVVSTKMTYRQSLKDNKNPIPLERPGYTGRREWTDEEKDNLETERRKKLAVEAMRSGFIISIVWPIWLVVFTILFGIGMTMKLFHTIAIKPEDKPFISDKEFRKAERIVKEYEEQQRNQFEKELE